MEQFVPQCMQKLVPMMNTAKLPRSLQENCAITIGRLGFVCPATVSPMLAVSLKRWFSATPDESPRIFYSAGV